jgi:hypothetical protein
MGGSVSIVMSYGIYTGGWSVLCRDVWDKGNVAGSTVMSCEIKRG